MGLSDSEKGGIAQGAAQGAVIGSAAVPGVGTVIGAVLGGILGGISAPSNRGNFRANRRAEFFRNQSLKFQALGQTRVARRFTSTQLSQAAGGNIAGATITGAQVTALIEASRARRATLAGLTFEFQSGSGRFTHALESPSPASRASQAQARERANIAPSEAGNAFTGSNTRDRQEQGLL